ncbi:hypothetical protein H310_11158 [Aphanomyces invadans]|uniref:Rieske domain-containing protein n=1 Tax=Aphanomyces invadans TaxID=157072 RepID=A0A024TMJ5_9STRA|nr:hypothetical protein H310_11158 [Aphanomyces invadans]ETV95253.1 hypothetical protein H310_11158 [Aphanomyces invadans]|eukprot:XP_008875954.1 hypothetical protein H310_11158 [Aphanomyces invadans]
MFTISKSSSSSLRNDLSPMLWFDTLVSPESVVDSKQHMPDYQYTVTGQKRIKKRERIQLGCPVVVNGKKLAIFRHGPRYFAIQQFCPHAGGNLALGDIEDIDNMLCITCPRHKWPFVLLSGDCLVGEAWKAEHFPVEARPAQPGLPATLFIGFPQLNNSLFYEEDF